MKRKTCFLPVFAIRLSLAYGVSFDVQAKRLGGGSFGGKPSYSQPSRRESPVNPYSQSIRSPSQQQAALKNQATRQASANRGGVSDIVGGLTLGGLLDSLLFGRSFEVIRDQLRSANFNSKIEVLNAQAELVDVGESRSEFEASMLFRAIMREDNGPEQQIREVWRFIRAANNPRPKWFLDGVQQFQE